MSYPNPSAPKALRRSRSNRYVGGVCGGVADYLNMDATLVRILTVLITLFTGVPVVLYVVALFLMPEQDVTPAGSVAPPQTYGAQPGSEDLWGPAGPPWSSTDAVAPAPADPPRREDSSNAS